MESYLKKSATYETQILLLLGEETPIPISSVNINKFIYTILPTIHELEATKPPRKRHREKAIAYSPAAGIVVSVDDLLKQILTRLPRKSLIRFKSASKRWFSVITSPEFHRNRGGFSKPNPSSLGFFLGNPWCNVFKPPVIEYAPLSGRAEDKEKYTSSVSRLNFYKMDILQSCNGLILARQGYDRFYVWCPTTNYFVMLPPSVPLMHVAWISLAFDPIDAPDHYHVVSIHFEESEDNLHHMCDALWTGFCHKPHWFQIQIYSSSTNIWVTSKAKVEFYRGKQVNLRREGVYWNGAMHWMSFSSNNESLYFNIDHQFIGNMPTPPIAEGRESFWFGEAGGRLYYVENQVNEKRYRTLMVYEMKRDYSEWFLKYKVDVHSHIHDVQTDVPASTLWLRYPKDRFPVSVFSVVKDDKGDTLLVLLTPAEMIKYNLVSKTCERLYEFDGIQF